MTRTLLRLAASLVLVSLFANASAAADKKPATAPDPALTKKQEAVALIEKQQAPLVNLSA